MAERGVMVFIGLVCLFACVAWFVSVICNWNNWQNMKWFRTITEIALAVASLLQIIDYFTVKKHSLAVWVYGKALTYFHDREYKKAEKDNLT